MGLSFSIGAGYYGYIGHSLIIGNYYNDSGVNKKINSITLKVGYGAYSNKANFTGGNPLQANGNDIAIYAECAGVTSNAAFTGHLVDSSRNITSQCGEVTLTFPNLIIGPGGNYNITLPFLGDLNAGLARSGHQGIVFCINKLAGQQSADIVDAEPPKHWLYLTPGPGVASFTGAGQYTENSNAISTATVAPGYHLAYYAGTNVTGEQQMWTSCAGLAVHQESWTMSIDRSITVYAEGNTYTVNFNPMGGSASVASLPVIYGTGNWNAGAISAIRNGYTLNGWYDSTTGGTLVYDASGYAVNSPGYWTGTGTAAIWSRTGNATLYAQWAPNAYPIYYNANGGSNPPAAQSKYHDIPLTLTTAVPSAKQYTVTYNANGGTVSPSKLVKSCTFSSWNTRADGRGASYKSGQVYTENVSRTLYATWNNPTLGTLTTSVSRANCIFVGWFSAINDGYQLLSTYYVTGNLTAYARWDYLISYDSQGGIVGEGQDGGGNTYIPPSTKHHQQALQLTAILPHKVGSTFLGWAETADATSPQYLPSGIYSKDEPTTLYAVYDTAIFTVTFDLRGGTYTGGDLVQKIPYHGSAVLPNTPTKDGCTFQGWSGNYTQIEQNTIVYAMWNSSPVWIKKDDGNWHSYVD